MRSPNMMMQFTEVCKTVPGHAFDFIAREYGEMGNDDLVDILKEILYSIHVNAKDLQARILEDAAIELDEKYEDLYGEEWWRHCIRVYSKEKEANNGS